MGVLFSYSFRFSYDKNILKGVHLRENVHGIFFVTRSGFVYDVKGKDKLLYNSKNNT